MKYHYVWLVWSSAFLVPWLILFALNPRYRLVMWRTSCWTALLAITEPIFVPEYWDPPSLLELARRTGFDIESFIFSFAIGGIGALLYHTFTRKDFAPVEPIVRWQPLHRFHLYALLAPFALFVPLYFAPWNPIYPSITCLVVGAIVAVFCRPDLRYKTLVGGVLFLGLYAIYMLGLKWLAPGYIEQVWNLPVLSGVLIVGIPLEELLFGFSFGLYWTGVYEHFSWKLSVARDHAPARSNGDFS